MPNSLQNSIDFITIEKLLTTFMLMIFSIIGSFSNFILILFHIHQNRAEYQNKKLNVRRRNQANNKAIYAVFIINFLLSFFFIPYTILFRVWDFYLNRLVFICVEHLKDSLIYTNLFIVSIISLERYVAVCKPQHYLKLQNNINKIIWLLFLIAFVLSTTNYLVANESSIRHQYNFTINKSGSIQLTIPDIVNLKINLRINLFVSAALLLICAIVSTWFYTKIILNQKRKQREFKIKYSFQSGKKSSRSSTLNKKETFNSQNVNKTDLDSSKHNEEESFNMLEETNQLHSAKIMPNCTKNKNTVSVQTDFDYKPTKSLYKNPSMSSSRLITKISILVNVFCTFIS